MTTANSTLRVSELDFQAIKTNLKDFLRQQDAFTDYDFEGSGMSVLIDLLAYNTHYMGYYLNMVANEMFLDTAQLRNSILSHAKAINYIPASKKGALVRTNIVVSPSVSEDQVSTILTLDRYTKFLAQDIDGVNYPFVALHSNTVSKSGDTFTFSNVYLKQGEVVTRQYIVGSSNATFSIPSGNVDTTTLIVTVQESPSNTFTESYELASDLTTLDANSKVFWVEEQPDQNYVFYFGDSIIGKRPRPGNIVIATYMDVVGSSANAISRFFLADPIGGSYDDNVSITAATASYGGVEKETVEQIRFRAPYFYTAQNRAVTRNDYESLLLHDYNNIDAVSVWGGEENDPVVYGKVYLSLKTKGNYALTIAEKEEIKSALIRSRNVLTVIPEIVDPDYNYVLMVGRVHYNPSLTSRTSGELLTLVRAAIADYNSDELNTFRSIFRKSRLQHYIESCEPSITGSDIDIFIQKRIELATNETKNYDIKFNMPLRKGDFLQKLYTYPTIVTPDLLSINRDTYYEEVPSSFTGVDSIEVVNPGINYATIPTVTISGDGTGASARAVVVNGKVNRIEMITKGANYTRATVTITGGDGSEATATAKLEARLGTLRTYYFKSNGEKVFINESAGTINYDTGALSLIGLLPLSVGDNPIYDDDVLTINAPTENEIIIPLRNRILTIDENNPQSIQIEMVAEN